MEWDDVPGKREIDDIEERTPGPVLTLKKSGTTITTATGVYPASTPALGTWTFSVGVPVTVGGTFSNKMNLMSKKSTHFQFHLVISPKLGDMALM